MSLSPSSPELQPKDFVVNVQSELDEGLVRQHPRAVNTILQVALVAGLQLDFDATLNILADLVRDIVPYHQLLVYFRQEGEERAVVRMQRGFEGNSVEPYRAGNVLNLWASQFSRPLLLCRGQNVDADTFLQASRSGSALVVPIVINNLAVGSLQLLSRSPEAFSKADAQLVWIFCLVAESQLSRIYGNQGLLSFAFTDYLTGLRSRGYFEQQLDLELKRAERKRAPVSLLMIDIDHFKLLNDEHGHRSGDQLLREVASILVRDMREVDTVARYGGEEFVIVLPETDEAGAQQVAQRLRRNIENTDFLVGSIRVIEHLTISVGIATYDHGRHSKKEFIEFADAALYEAKHRGRNQVVTYSEVATNRIQLS